MSTLKELRPRIIPTKYNKLTSQQRSDAGKLGKGDGALSPKQARWWLKAQKRIEAIAERERVLQMAGTGVDVIRTWRHAYRATLSAHKF